MKEVQEFEGLKKKTQNLLSRVNKKLQKTYVFKYSLHYNPVSGMASPELVDAEETIEVLKPLRQKLTEALVILEGEEGEGEGN